MKVILALDIGSSSIRCTAYPFDSSSISSPIASSALPCRSVEPNTGKISLHMDIIDGSLLDKIDQSVLKVLKELPEDVAVVAVGFSSFVMNLIGVDRHGTPLGDDFTLSYACNTSDVAKECQSIRQNDRRVDLEHDYHQSTGATFHPAYALGQLRVIYKTRPKEKLDLIHTWQTLASLSLSRWTGQVCLSISYSEASWAGLLNFQRCEWDDLAMELLPNQACRESLPLLADFNMYQPGIPERIKNGDSNPYWTMFPQLRSAKLFLGIGDGACANIGSKCSTASRIAVTIGTSAAARICLAQGIGDDCQLSFSSIPRGLFCYRIDRNHLLVGGALTDGGSVVEWLCQLLNLDSQDEFEACMRKAGELTESEFNTNLQRSTTTVANLSARLLVVIPFLSGERSTGHRAGATGTIMGLTRETRSEHLMKASLEGISLRLREVIELILSARDMCVDKEEPSDDEIQSHQRPCIVASGKSLEVNESWRQMIADCSGLDVIFDPSTTEGTSRGVARLVASALETDSLVLQDELLYEAETQTSNPRPAMRQHYDEMARAQGRFIGAMSSLWSD